LNNFNSNTNKDYLNNILLNLFSNSSFINGENKTVLIETRNKKYNGSLLDFILTSLKHKDMSGVRLEGKGRLTRRLIASRAVFKIK
jgi:hypothetical protein